MIHSVGRGGVVALNDGSWSDTKPTLIVSGPKIVLTSFVTSFLSSKRRQEIYTMEFFPLLYYAVS